MRIGKEETKRRGVWSVDKGCKDGEGVGPMHEKFSDGAVIPVAGPN